MDSERVVVTGMGIVSSIGLSAAEFTHNLIAGKSGFSSISALESDGFPSSVAGVIHSLDTGFEPKNLDPSKIGRTSLMAVMSSSEALNASGLTHNELSRLNISVVYGTTDGECQAVEERVRQQLGLTSAHPNAMAGYHADHIAANVAAEYGFTGSVCVISTACAAGNYAIGHGFDQIKSGNADVVVCGGADAFSRKTFAGFSRLGAVANDVCRPFDKDRKGMIPGEGAATLILERYDHAKARCAHIYAEVLGFAINCDAKHMVAPEVDSIARCMQLAQSRAGITPSEVSYICTHGTGTPTNDVVESRSINAVFNRSTPPVSSIKSQIGHTMGAASAIAACTSCFAIDQGFIPATMNFRSLDPMCEVDCVPNHVRYQELSIVQNNAFAFGGNNAVVLFGNANRMHA